MARLDAGALGDLQRRQRAVGRHRRRAGRPHRIEQRLGDLHREVEVLGLEAPGAVDRGAALHHVDLGVRDHAQHVGRLRADVLGAQVTRHVVRHGPHRPAEARVERALGVEPGQVLEQVARVAGDEARVVGAVEPRVLLLQHVAAGRARRHDLAALPHGRGQRADVVADQRPALVHRTAVEVRHAAAALLRQRHVDTVALEHRHRGAADGGGVVLDGARREQGDFLRPPGRRHARRACPIRDDARIRRASVEPRRERGAMKLRQPALAMDAGDRLHERPVDGQLVHPVRQRGREAAELPHQVGVPEHPVLELHAAAARVHRPRPQHQPWEIDRPAMRRSQPVSEPYWTSLPSLRTYEKPVGRGARRLSW